MQGKLFRRLDIASPTYLAWYSSK